MNKDDLLNDDFLKQFETGADLTGFSWKYKSKA